jgi:hypothetical protein
MVTELIREKGIMRVSGATKRVPRKKIMMLVSRA